MVMDSSGKFNFNLSTVLPLSLLTLSSSPDFQQVYSIQWSEFNDDAEQWRRSAQQTTLAYCSPLQTQIINSSIHATSFRRGLHTSLGLLLLRCRCCQFLQHFWNPIYRFGHVYKNAMPGSGDLTFDALHWAGLILSKLSSKLQLPFSFDGKSKRQKMWQSFCPFSSLIMFYCILLGNKKSFCDPMNKLDDLK